MSYFLTAREIDKSAREADVDRRGELGKTLPVQLIELDRSVSASVLQVLKSDHAKECHAHLKETRDKMTKQAHHAEIVYAFRSSFITMRCRELWRFTLRPDQDILFSESQPAFGWTCEKCGTADGYQPPRYYDAQLIAQGYKNSQGSLYTQRIVTEEMERHDNVIAADFMEMRGKGLFDDTVRSIVVAMKEHKLIALDYSLSFVSMHRLLDGRVAISSEGGVDCAGRGLTVPRDTFYTWPRSYFAPCEHCKGAGCLAKEK